jgi:Mitochondrial carrier protein
MPADTVKSVIQTSTAQPPKMLTVASSIIAQHGATALFKGLGVAVIRAFPANAGNDNSNNITLSLLIFCATSLMNVS